MWHTPTGETGILIKEPNGSRIQQTPRNESVPTAPVSSIALKAELIAGSVTGPKAIHALSAALDSSWTPQPHF